jgi:hypothetical protein
MGPENNYTHWSCFSLEELRSNEKEMKMEKKQWTELFSLKMIKKRQYQKYKIQVRTV